MSAPGSVPRSSPLVAAVTVLATAAGLVAMGVANGSYDIVPRQTAGLILWWCVGLGALVLLRPPRAASLPSLLTVGFGLAVVGWITLNVSDSISVERSANELVRALTHVAPLLLIGWVLPRSLWRPVIVGVALAGVVLSAVALASRLDPGFLADRQFTLFRNTNQRLSIPMGYWNAVGLTAAMSVLLLLAIASHAPTAIGRALALAGTPVGIAAAYLTYARSPLGAAALGAAVLFATSRNRVTFLVQTTATALAGAFVVVAIRGQEQIALGTGAAGRGAVITSIVVAAVALAIVGALTGRFRTLDGLRMPPRPAMITATVTAIVTLVVGIAAVNRYGQEAWDSFTTPEQGGTYADPSQRLTTLNTTRAQQWEKALDAWRDERSTGYGAGTFELVYNQRQEQGEFVRDAHNAYVETLAEQGTLGLVLLLGLLGSAAAAIALAIRRAATDLDRGLLAGTAAVFGAFVLGTGVDWFWEVTSIAMLVLVLVGAALAATARADDDTRRRRIPGWATRAAVVALALVAVLAELPGLVGTSEQRRSARAVAAGDLERARDHADRAIDILPWASSPFLQRALVDEQAGQWRSALRAMQLAERRDPQDWRLPLVTARIEARSGDADAALEAYRRAKKLRPYGNFFR